MAGRPIETFNKSEECKNSCPQYKENPQIKLRTEIDSKKICPCHQNKKKKNILIVKSCKLSVAWV